jgi:hypothetical protein
LGWKEIKYKDKELKAFEGRFKKKAKFLVDENLGPELSNYLKETGWNTKYISEYGQ